MSTSKSSRQLTLQDVLDAIANAKLPALRCRDMASAVRTVCRLIDREPSAIPLDLQGLGFKLASISPQAVSMSGGRWNNVRSLFRAAVDLVRPVLRGRTTDPMSEAWQAIFDRLPTKTDQSNLSRVFRWLSVRQIEPATVLADDLCAFRHELLHNNLRRNPELAWRNLIRTWNRNAKIITNLPSLGIVIASRKEVFTLPWSAFDPALKRDVDAWLRRLAGRDFADDGPSRPARPETLKTREYQLRAFASALVLRGRDLASLRSLADLVTLEAFTDGLRFFHERRGGQTTSAVHGMASMLLSVARHWAQADEPTLKRLQAITRNLAPADVGLTQKNMDRLRPLNDPEVAEKLLCLPLRLRAEVEAGKLPRRRAAVLAQLAVAIEILLMAPMRRLNLAALDMDEHFVRVGSHLHLVLPAHEVKNRTELEYLLPPDSVALVDWYLKAHRPVLAIAGCAALFPGVEQGSKRGHTLGLQVKRLVKKYTGLEVNAHLFRHIAAKLYLDAHPGGYEIVRRVLGHKKMETTTHFYTGLESAAAAKHFDQVIQRIRNRSTSDPAPEDTGGSGTGKPTGGKKKP